MIVWLAVIIGAVALDQLTKWITVIRLDVGESFPFIEGIFHFTYIQNRGAAFGMLSNHRWVFMVTSTVAIVGLLIYLWKFRPESKLACASLAMIIGGGIGNMIDRLFYKGTLPDTIGENVVIDFLDFCAVPEIWPWVFNIADSFVCVGAGILMVWCVVSIFKEAKLEKQKKLEANAAQQNDGEENDG